MKITRIQATPMRVPYKRPYHWSQGIIEAAETVLIAIHGEDGLVGYGEAMAGGSPEAALSYCQAAGELLIGRDASRINGFLAELHQKLFASCGNLGGRRFAATFQAGFDMALWDLLGKAAGQPVHALLGGAVRDEISYFGFPQGETAEEVAEDARAWAEHGSEVIYFKVGRGAEFDLETVRQVRAAIGDRRLRLDANEVWDVLTARRMIRAFEPFDVEFLEQPTPRASLSAMKAVRDASPIPIAADQSVYSAEDVFDVCRTGAADMVVVGLHEAGGMTGLLKCAAVAEAAGIKLCLHGLYETGIGTCATLQAGAVIPNLDDANQIMHHFLVEDVVAGSDLTLERGRLPILQGPGLGFELDWDAVARAEERARMTKLF